MFWHLLLAHFIADYPLQPNWMVANKRRPSVLLLHIGTHFVVMLLLVGATHQALWPFVLLLASIHLIIDVGKITLNARRPDWVVVPYLVDQLLHVISIVGIAYWIGQSVSMTAPPLSPQLAVLATAYLLVTYVWFISERVMAYAAPDYRQELVAQAWPRMFARAIFFSGFLWLIGPRIQVKDNPAVLIALPYVDSRYGRRAVLIDLLVAAGGLLFVIWALQ